MDIEFDWLSERISGEVELFGKSKRFEEPDFSEAVKLNPRYIEYLQIYQNYHRKRRIFVDQINIKLGYVLFEMGSLITDPIETLERELKELRDKLDFVSKYNNKKATNKVVKNIKMLEDLTPFIIEETDKLLHYFPSPELVNYLLQYDKDIESKHLLCLKSLIIRLSTKVGDLEDYQEVIKQLLVLNRSLDVRSKSFLYDSLVPILLSKPYRVVKQDQELTPSEQDIYEIGVKAYPLIKNISLQELDQMVKNVLI